MKKDDPKREAAGRARDEAQFNLEILAQGLGRALAMEHYRHSDRIRYLIKRINTDLLKAVEAAEAAEEAYRPYPYWRSLPRKTSKVRQIHSHKAPGGKNSAS
jgi:hypothetical protein